MEGLGIASMILPAFSGLKGFSVTDRQETVQPMVNQPTDLMALSDEKLAQLILNGQAYGIDELIKRYSFTLYSIIRRMMPSDSIAEDILQDTWLLVIRNLHHYDISRPLKPWLCRIAINSCRNHWRREKRHQFWRRLTGKAETDSQFFETAENPCEAMNAHADVSKAILTLPPKFREIVSLKFYSGLTHDEIAEITGLPSGTVKSRLHHALEKLRQYFERKGRA